MRRYEPFFEKMSKPLKKIMSVGLFFLFLAVVHFPGTLLAEEKNSTDLFKAGKELFDASAFDDAFLIFSQLFRENPENREVNFYMGRAAFEKGDYETALMAFDRILISNPDDLRTKLEMARCHIRLGSTEAAKGLFNEVLAENPPEAVRKNIEDYLKAMDQADKRHSINGFLSFDAAYDSNANSFSSNPKINLENLDIVTSEEEDLILSLMGQIDHVYRFENHKLSWKTSGMAYNSLYQDMTDLNLNYLSIGTGPSFQVLKSDIDTRLYYDFIMLDGVKYMDIFGLGASFSYPLFSTLKAFVMAKWSLLDYENPLNEKDGNSIGLNTGLFFSTGKTAVTLSIDGEKESADEDWNSFERIGTTLSCVRELPWELIASAIFKYRFTSYLEPDSAYLLIEKSLDDDEVREDHYFSGTAGLSRKLWRSGKTGQSLSGQLMVTFINSDSTYSLYTYDKQTVSIGVVYGF